MAGHNERSFKCNSEVLTCFEIDCGSETTGKKLSILFIQIE